MICSVEGCEKPAARLTEGLCWGHLKRKQRGEPVNVPLATPTTTRNTKDAVRELALKYADVNSDDDEEFRRADRNLFNAVESYARRATSEKIRNALAERRANGEHVGRPATVIDEAELERVRRGEQKAIDLARGLKVSQRTIQRHVKKTTKP